MIHTHLRSLLIEIISAYDTPDSAGERRALIHGKRPDKTVGLTHHALPKRVTADREDLRELGDIELIWIDRRKKIWRFGPTQAGREMADYFAQHTDIDRVASSTTRVSFSWASIRATLESVVDAHEINGWGLLIGQGDDFKLEGGGTITGYRRQELFSLLREESYLEWDMDHLGQIRARPLARAFVVTRGWPGPTGDQQAAVLVAALRTARGRCS